MRNGFVKFFLRLYDVPGITRSTRNSVMSKTGMMWKETADWEISTTGKEMRFC